ncbi:hypothetical protein GEMRC1_001042 [Eukaryota sp. GEM-RC1]
MSKRLLLAEYYGVQTDVSSTPSRPLDLDSSSFDKSSYLQSITTSLTHKDLCSLHSSVEQQVTEYQNKLHGVVYENYAKFLAATDVVSSMSSSSTSLSTCASDTESLLESVSSSMSSLLSTSRSQEKSLTADVASMKSMLSTIGAVKQLNVLVDIPLKIEEFLRCEFYGKCISLFSAASAALTPFKTSVEGTISNLKGFIDLESFNSKIQKVKESDFDLFLQYFFLNIALIRIENEPMELIMNKILNYSKIWTQLVVKSINWLIGSNFELATLVEHLNGLCSEFLIFLNLLNSVCLSDSTKGNDLHVFLNDSFLISEFSKEKSASIGDSYDFPDQFCKYFKFSDVMEELLNFFLDIVADFIRATMDKSGLNSAVIEILNFHKCFFKFPLLSSHFDLTVFNQKVSQISKSLITFGFSELLPTSLKNSALFDVETQSLKMEFSSEFQRLLRKQILTKLNLL